MPRKPQRSSQLSHFFLKELAGEQPPSRATLQTLYPLAVELLAREPWKRIAESQLVLTQDPVSKETCYCSIMGTLGEVMSLHAYVGAESYRLFARLRSGEPTTIGDFYAGQHAVYVQFVELGELTPPDRDMLGAMGHELMRGSRAPLFRAVRPGYHAWYPTEEEAQTLIECHRVVLAVCTLLDAKPGAGYWEEEEVYPLLSRPSPEAPWEIRPAKAPVSTVAMPQLPRLDEERLQRIRARKLPARRVLEVDHFYGGGRVGKRHERKACIRIAVAIDAETAHVYPPVVSSPKEFTGDLLADALLRAIEAGHARPLEVHVRDRQFKILLDPLALALGFPVKVVKNMPALDFAKSQLLSMMGDPGPIGPA